MRVLNSEINQKGTSQKTFYRKPCKILFPPGKCVFNLTIKTLHLINWIGSKFTAKTSEWHIRTISIDAIFAFLLNLNILDKP